MRLIDEINVLSKEHLFRQGADYFDAQKILHDATASSKPGRTKLRIRGPGTFSGRLTNWRSYPGRKVKEGTATWLKDYAKPVLRHHKSGKLAPDFVEDPIGRIVDAKYVQTVSDSIWAEDALKPMPTGTGYTELTADIADPESIQKILDGRYLTMSVGFDTNGIYCSVCTRDWKAHGPCEHMPGRISTVGDSKKGTAKNVRMHFFTGDLTYEELSFVNRPANSLAVITSAELLTDALLDIELPDVPTTELMYDSIEIDGVIWQAVNPKDKEVISVSTASPTAERLSGGGKDTTDVKPETISHSVSDAVVKNLEDKTDVKKSCQKTDLPKSKEPSMAETQDTKVEGTEEVKPLPIPTVDVAQIQKELADAKLTLTQRDEEVKALRDDNTRLALEVQKNLAKRLLDLRISMEDPTVDAAKKDQAKYTEFSVDYAKRSRASLEDAIRDEETRLSIKATMKPEVKEIPRGSVTPESVGIQVDNKSDTPKTEDSKEAKNVDASSYKGGLRNRFKNLTK